MNRAFIATLLAVITQAAMAQTIIHVSDTAPPGGDGESWATAFNDLQDALGVGARPVEIWVAAGVYKPSFRDVTATFAVTSQQALYGGFRGDETAREQRDPHQHITVLSGDLADNDGPDFIERWDNVQHVLVFRETDDTALLDGFRIRGGYADGADAMDRRGGGILLDRSDAIVRDCIIDDCHADDYGGGICVLGGAPRIERVTVRGCRALGATVFDEQGGGLYLEASAATVQECDFLGNMTPSGWGGGVALRGGPTTTIRDCRFVANSATRGGGLLLFGITGGAADCIFEDNEAAEGGAVYCFSATTAVHRCLFERNRARRGSALLCEKSQGVVFEDCDWISNGADETGERLTDRGGAIECDSSRLDVLGGRFLSNRAYASGGAVHVTSGLTTCRGVSFEDNGAANGGAAGLGGGELVLVECDLYRNWAIRRGGAVWSLSTSLIQFHNSTIRANWAGSAGGAVAAQNVRVANCAVFSNEARQFDGGAFLVDDSLEITGSTIALNVADGLGGGIRRAFEVSSLQRITIANSIFWGNRADDSDLERQQISLRDFTPDSFRIDFSLVEGWTGSLPGERSAGADPLLADPLGPDELPLTGDEDVRTAPGSPARDAGANDLIGPDWADLDGDGDVTEPAPYALGGTLRRIDDQTAPDTGRGEAPLVDIGAWEAETPVCRADLNGDGKLDFFDFLEFQSLFAAGDPRADFTGDGILDFFDFLAFQEEFSKGCP